MERRELSDVITEVAEYMEGRVKEGVDRLALAAELVNNKWDMSGAVGKDIGIEIPSHYTLTGNPITAEFDGPEVDPAA